MNTRRSLREDIIQLGVRQGDLVMVHAGIRAVGPILGGVNTLVQALFDVLGPPGTLIAYVDFEPFFEEEDVDASPDDIPLFDKRIAQAARDHGVLHETLRNWPGALRSDHPDAGVVAIGARAEWMTAEHPFQYGYGPGSPLAKVTETHGRVLMVGAPLDTITLLHHAEHLADIPKKRVHHYRRRMPGKAGEPAAWVDFEEFDTRDPVADYLPEDCFARIGTAALDAGCGVAGRIGEAASFLYEAQELVRFAVAWLERFAANRNS